jgi:lysophospholipase L1-like esterase
MSSGGFRFPRVGIIGHMTISFLVIMLAVALLLFILSRVTVETIARHHYEQRADFFHRYPVNKGDIVFLGDSITDGGCWEELFPGVPLKNRGINADTTAGVLKRLDDLLLPGPAAIFLLIGTNDLPWYTYQRNEDILHEYRQILNRVKELSPTTQVFVQSLLPRRKRFSRRIRGLNTALQSLATEFSYTYIDLYSHFVGTRGELRRELTNDNLHLLAGGYTLWVELLTPYVKNLSR